MSDNRNPYRLEPIENERIFREQILPDILNKNPTLRPNDTPTMLVVGGQPGAGKSHSINEIKAEFAGRSGVLIVDLDALRENHPAHKPLMRADDKAAAQYTYDDARVWAQKLEDYAKANRHNVLVESLMTSPDGVGGWLQDYRQAGYRTEAHVVAVNERSSVQGIVQRYEREKFRSEDNVGRTVPREVHNLAYDRVRDTFDRIETDQSADRVVVHGRNGQVLYDNHLQANGQWEHPPGGARIAIEAERGRSLSPTQWRDHIQAYDDIQANQRRPERGATAAEVDEVRQLRTASVREGGLTAQVGLHPTLSRTAVGAGALTTAYDATVTGRQAWQLHQEGNAVGVESEVMRFGARNVGAWGGALVGAKVGTLAGVETGPGMLLTGIAGAGVGAWGAEQMVDWIEQNRINTQADRNGIEWRFNPEHPEKGWQREVVDAFAERGLSLKHTETAPADVADALNYKASAVAVQLRLSTPDIPVNPYEIPADSSDTRSLRESPWIRDAETQAWRREVVDGMIDRVAHRYTEKADPVTNPVKAAELDAYSQSVIAYNAARQPAVIAANFESVYRDNGWDRHGEIPPAVRNARSDTETLIASDGDRYRRGQDGIWTSDGLFYDSTARVNLRDELEATHGALRARLDPPPQMRPDTRIEVDPHAIERPSELEHDAREQAQHEANRQGLSHDDVQQAVTAPTRSVHGGRREDESHEQEAARDGEQQKRADPGHADPGTTTSAPQPARATDPRNPDHPDHRLYAQIEAGVARIDASTGRTFDATSERLAMSTLADVKAAGITSADHLALNTTGKPQQDGSRIASGTLLFVVQGQDPSDPAARRSITDVVQAVERPLEQSQQKLDTVNQHLAQQQNKPTQDEPTPDGPAPKGPRM